MTLITVSTAAIFTTLLLFCRVGTLCMFLPAIGDGIVPVRVRLIFGLMFSIACSYVVSAMHKGLEAKILMALKDHYKLVTLIVQELCIGLLIGSILKITISAVHIGGTAIASQIGLGSASLFDPTQQTQGNVINQILSILVTLLFFTTGMHLEVLKGLIYSYTLIPIDQVTSQNYMSSFLPMLLEQISNVWSVGIGIAMPFIIASIILMIGSGVLSKLMPQLQIFFLILPVQVLLGIIVLIISISGICTWFMSSYYGEVIQTLFT